MIPCTQLDQELRRPECSSVSCMGTALSLTCWVSVKLYSLAIASIATLRTILSMLHSASVNAKGMVNLAKECPTTAMRPVSGAQLVAN